jgi:peroxiredoxin Q/BCP
MVVLNEGDKAPAFSGIDANGKPVSLADFKGKKLVLYFYPKDDTPGCTAEACSLRDDYAELRKKGYEILGVSPDAPSKHQKFIEKYALPFRLLADTDRVVLQAYGAWGPKKFMGKDVVGVIRTTFIIDEAGNIEKIFRKVDTQNHAQEILAASAG